MSRVQSPESRLNYLESQDGDGRSLFRYVLVLGTFAMFAKITCGIKNTGVSRVSSWMSCNS
jgi:hypothetical protein